ncbi:hypothetical protein DdX_12564 [Ditylenchus destructor]|uniref:Uncharacterized protein n=1 Tax=Ditylenchus destructor TaxID=166010 RepID=A0AAD4MYN1_9BILA|nr:hypothetical protein DdX_12564 [Ditylenchus destructor]
MEFRTVSVIILFNGLLLLTIFDAGGDATTCVEMCFTTLQPKDGSHRALKQALNLRALWCHIMKKECPNECAQVCAKNWEEESEGSYGSSSASSSGED